MYPHVYFPACLELSSQGIPYRIQLQDTVAAAAAAGTVGDWHSNENRGQGYCRAWRSESVVLGCAPLLTDSAVLGELQKVQSLGLLLSRDSWRLLQVKKNANAFS